MKIALRVDVDTNRGTHEGVPKLLRLLDKAGVQASFYFSLGPDTTGRAILRVFKRRGFLKKMQRTSALKIYGLRTVLSGTLLPAPLIGRQNRAVIRSVEAAGHEIGVHAWDHIAWHDGVENWTGEKIRRWYDAAFTEFAEAAGRPPRAFCAPAWKTCDRALEILETYHLDYATDCRGLAPFFPIVSGKTLATLQLPATTPTLDEIIGREDVDQSDLNAALLAALAPNGFNCHTLHTELEGQHYPELFLDLLARMKSAGYSFITLADWAAELKKNPAVIPAKSLERREVAGRSGWLSVEGGASLRG